MRQTALDGGEGGGGDAMMGLSFSQALHSVRFGFNFSPLPVKMNELLQQMFKHLQHILIRE